MILSPRPFRSELPGASSYPIGKKLEEFKPSRGIRQGDPISPYLFLLAAKFLSGLLKTRDPSSQLGGLQVAPDAPRVNHLLSADDNLLLFKANDDSLPILVEPILSGVGTKDKYEK